MEILKVSSRSVPNSVAGAVSGVIRDSGAVEVQAVGAGAANQAIKAIAIARGYLAPLGIDLIVSLRCKRFFDQTVRKELRSSLFVKKDNNAAARRVKVLLLLLLKEGTAWKLFCRLMGLNTKQYGSFTALSNLDLALERVKLSVC